jgi:hypothetical protein
MQVGSCSGPSPPISSAATSGTGFLNKSREASMLKCYDSVTDGSLSRWSFHTACIDSTVPRDTRCRRNVVVRSFVFF